MKGKKIILVSLFLVLILVLILLRKSLIEAYYTYKFDLNNNFKIGKIQGNVEETVEGEVTNVTLMPNNTINKKVELSNSGDFESYIRAQVYVPIARLKYVNTQDESIVTPNEDIEIVSYEINGQDLERTGYWEEVQDERFTDIVQDTNGNKYKVYTYKYMEKDIETPIQEKTKISVSLFDEIKTINFLDDDSSENFKIIVKAIAIQAQNGKSSETMWNYYVNQNGSGVGEVK